MVNCENDYLLVICFQSICFIRMKNISFFRLEHNLLSFQEIKKTATLIRVCSNYPYLEAISLLLSLANNADLPRVGIFNGFVSVSL